MNNIITNKQSNEVPTSHHELTKILENEHMFNNSPAVDTLQIGVHRLNKIALNHDERLDALESDKKQHHKTNEKLLEVLKGFNSRITALEEAKVTDIALDDDNNDAIDFAKFSSMKEAYLAGTDDGFESGYISGVYHCEAGLITSNMLEKESGIQ